MKVKVCKLRKSEAAKLCNTVNAPPDFVFVFFARIHHNGAGLDDGAKPVLRPARHGGRELQSNQSFTGATVAKEDRNVVGRDPVFDEPPAFWCLRSFPIGWPDQWQWGNSGCLFPGEYLGVEFIPNGDFHDAIAYVFDEADILGLFVKCRLYVGAMQAAMPTGYREAGGTVFKRLELCQWITGGRHVALCITQKSFVLGFVDRMD